MGTIAGGEAMGRQLLFYMDEETEKHFAEFVLQQGGELLYRGNEARFRRISCLPEPFAEPGWFEVFLWKTGLGTVKPIVLEDGREYIDPIEEPVIEFTRTAVSHDERVIRQGRLWVEMKFWNDEQELVEKPQELAKWYNALTRWVKKHVPRQEVLIGGYPYKEYISSSLMELVRDGYKLE
jgi:hypothetical protein